MSLEQIQRGPRDRGDEMFTWERSEGSSIPTAANKTTYLVISLRECTDAFTIILYVAFVQGVASAGEHLLPPH